MYRILDEGMEKEIPEFQRPSSATFPAKTFNEKQATVVGYVLIVIGCLSFFFNSIDLAIGTGGGSEFYTLSHVSLGVAGHGLWSGILVSVRSLYVCINKTCRPPSFLPSDAMHRAIGIINLSVCPSFCLAACLSH